MDNSIQQLAENILLIASQKTWIEGNAVQQLQTTAKLGGMKQVVGLPDLHAGRGYPIGAAFFSVGTLYPALIGGDIGCGMALWQTTIKQSGLHLDKLEKRIGNIDKRLETEGILQIFPEIRPLADGTFACGTIGAGNHFAELLSLDTVYCRETAAEIGLNKKCLQLLIHSGSRGIGGEILRRHIELFGHRGLSDNSPSLVDYLIQHQFALAYAEQNRQLIARRILANLVAQGECLLDIPHNFVEQAEFGGQQGWLHRKGSAPSDQGLVIIPGSRGSYSYLVKPTETDVALRSLAHGAGRKWNRNECKGRLSHYIQQEQLVRTEFGSRVICRNKDLLYEEAPQAYKSIETIIDALLQAGLITLIARFKPRLTYKVNQEEA
ncbi:RNA ligase RtcB family protein [Glaesserella sp.]|uniref:RNA ligase RtcB family protein n=1 Tax=Glaesserella sp. TaxID=2094731 RepID=UPI0035A1B0E6